MRTKSSWGELGPLDVQVDDVLEYGKRTFSPLNDFKSMEFLRDYATEFLDFFSWVLVERGFSVKQALHEAIPGVTQIMGPLYSHIDPTRLGSYRRLLTEGEEYAVRLLTSVDNSSAKRIAQRLVWKYPSHGFVIDRDEARDMGLPVYNMEVPHDKVLTKLVTQLMENEVTYVGFVPPRERKEKRQRTPAEEVPVSSKRPIPVAKQAS